MTLAYLKKVISFQVLSTNWVTTLRLPYVLMIRVSAMVRTLGTKTVNVAVAQLEKELKVAIISRLILVQVALLRSVIDAHEISCSEAFEKKTSCNTLACVLEKSSG